MRSSNPNGVWVEYTYDSLNRLSTVVDHALPMGQQTTAYTYDSASNLATVTYPNGLQSQFTLDNLNRVTSLNNAKLIYDYELDATGNRKKVIEHLANDPTGRTVNWSYDNIYRLTDEVITLDPHSKNGNAHYDLDPVGNRTQETATLPGLLPGSFTYDADDRLNTETYDANGNTLTSGGKTFAYDFENRLKSVTAGSVTVTIQYDADGNRVAKTVNGVTTRYLVDDLNPTGYAQVVEEVTNGAVTRQYTYGLQRISQTQQIANAWTPAFYGYDGGGTVRLLTDNTGTVTDTYDYDAWGNTVNTTGSTPNVCLYRGEQYDPDLGLYYLRARYFNPLTGRFLARDSDYGTATDPRTLHKYVYTASDPVNRIDPTGHDGVVVGALQRPMTGAFAQFLTNAIVGTTVGAGALAAGWCVWAWAEGDLELGAWKDSGSVGAFPDLPPNPTGGLPGAMGDALKEIARKCRPKSSCDKDHPGVEKCSALEGRGFGYGSPGRAKDRNHRLDKDYPADTCKSGGRHYRIWGPDGFVDTVLCCNCCDDRGGTATLGQRCARGEDLHDPD
jgi:RHS repeat-associated protein